MTFLIARASLTASRKNSLSMGLAPRSHCGRSGCAPNQSLALYLVSAWIRSGSSAASSSKAYFSLPNLPDMSWFRGLLLPVEWVISWASTPVS